MSDDRHDRRRRSTAADARASAARRAGRPGLRGPLLRRGHRRCWRRWAGCWSRWSSAAGRRFTKFGFSFFTTSTWNPVTDVYGAAGPDRRHPGHRLPGAALRAADRRSASRSSWSSSARRCCAGRSARRWSCSPASPRSSTACGACSSSRRWFAQHVQLPLMTARQAGLAAGEADHRHAQRRRHPVRLDHPGDHDPAVHGRDPARAAADRAGRRCARAPTAWARPPPRW